MELISRKKSLPVFTMLGILASGCFVVFGITELNDGDPVKACIRIFTGLFMVIGWIGNVRNQIVQIIVDDKVIRYSMRKGADIVIQREDVIDSEVRPARIRFRYKGPLDVRSASIPLRRFEAGDAQRLREIFANEEAVKMAAMNAP